MGYLGLAQCTELCLQLRGECGKRQVPGARVALQHNLGLGGAVIVALYRLGFPHKRLVLKNRHNLTKKYVPYVTFINTIMKS